MGRSDNGSTPALARELARSIVFLALAGSSVGGLCTIVAVAARLVGR